MKRKIGIMVESLKLGIKGGIAKAGELGADGIQVYVTKGETAPEQMDSTDREDFRKLVESHGLTISALCGDMGLGFMNPADNAEVVRRTKGFIDLAVDLGTHIVTTHIGNLPEDRHAPEWEAALETASTLAHYAEERGCYIASETGPESPVTLSSFLKEVGNDGMKVNYDPANFIMLGPFDHIGGVEVLRDYIVHTHAKDGVCLMAGTSGKPNNYLEVPLGEGSVAFKHYLAALDRIGYDGFLTIEREVGSDPVGDVKAAIQFLRSFE